ncbi:MAG: DNA gyrase inhibitor YacG [Elioraea sp.]|nr:DNA gyrase inhibitor YacG [Elioraea sp.]
MAEPAKTPACPICGKPAEPRWRPFCSRRCADIDLGRWFAGVYRLPTDKAPDGSEAEWTGADDQARRSASRRGPR